MLGVVDGVGIDLEVERAAIAALDLGLGDDLDEMVVAAAIGDQIGDGADLEPVRAARRRPGPAAAPWCRRRS